MEGYVKLRDGIAVDPYRILDEMFREAPNATADAWSCRDDVIRNVMDQVLTGFTDAMSHGDDDCGARADPGTPLSRARRRVAELAGDVAKRELDSLSRALARAHQMEKHYMDWAFELYHAWPDDISGRPNLPDLPRHEE